MVRCKCRPNGLHLPGTADRQRLGRQRLRSLVLSNFRCDDRGKLRELLMKRLLLVLLIPVAAQFGVHGFRAIAKEIGEASVDHWEQTMIANVEREFPRE